jgi:ribosomal protein L12E/L44/L45/RPP1/RPP2
MKVGIATTLSIAGVLAAGAAAFAVNSSVLSASTGTPITGAIAQQEVISNKPAAMTPLAPLVKQASVNSTQVTSKVTTYAVGTSGSVVIDTTSGAIVVTNVIPAAGWTSEPARTEANGNVKVYFSSGSSRIEFTARMVNGTVAVEVSVEEAKPALTALAPAPGTASPAPTAKPAYREDDDERDHDDEDDDREEHDEDEDDD